MPAPLAAGAAVAGWRLLRPLGAGAQSQVWLARQDDAFAALKLQPLPAGPGQAAAAEAFLRAASLARGSVRSRGGGAPAGAGCGRPSRPGAYAIAWRGW